MMNNYCRINSPLVEYKKQIIIATIIIFIIGIVGYIVMPGVEEASKKIQSQLQNVTVKSNSVKIVLSTILLIAIILCIVTYLFYRTVIFQREKRCLQVYQLDNYPQISMNSPDNTYHNPYFNQDMTYLLRDFYILGAAQVSLPCGQTKDLSSSKAIENVIRKGARWLEFDIFWTPDDNLNTNPKAYLSTGNEQKPTHLIFNDTDMLTLEEGLKTCAELAWKETDTPLFIVIRSKRLLENTILPSLYLEKNIAANWAAAFYNHIPAPAYLGFRTQFGQIPMTETPRKAFLILNWDPRESRLIELTTARINPPQEIYPQNGIQQINITPQDIPYGGIRSKFVNTDELIQYNKFNFTVMNYITSQNSNNLTSPKADIDNCDTLSAYDLGVQVIPQHFTIFPGKDNCFLKNLQFFKDGPIKLKPESLRYIPRPSQPVRKQYNELSYASKEYVNSRPGFASLQI